jgi:hypothetical protein
MKSISKLNLVRHLVFLSAIVADEWKSPLSNVTTCSRIFQGNERESRTPFSNTLNNDFNKKTSKFSFLVKK